MGRGGDDAGKEDNRGVKQMIYEAFSASYPN